MPTMMGRHGPMDMTQALPWQRPELRAPGAKTPYELAQEQNKRDTRSMFWKQIILPTAAFVTGGAALGAAGGGATASAAPAWSMSGVTAPSFGAPVAAAGSAGTAATGGAMASRIPWLRVGEKAADTLFGIYGNRQQRGANREALAYQMDADNRAAMIEAAEREQLQRNFDAQQAELKRQWDANQKFEADQFAASEEERLHNRRLADEREVRRGPYREASAAALARIPSILAGGRTSPGMGSLGSYRGGR